MNGYPIALYVLVIRFVVLGDRMRRWVAVLRNPKSGSGQKQTEIRHLVNHLQRYNLQPQLFSSRERLQRHLENSHRRAALVCIVAAGGDGTVRDVINWYPGLPLSILPLGTENLLARHLGIAFSGRQVAKMIATGRVLRMDLGRIGEFRFAVMASVGFDADVVHRLHVQRAGRIHRLTYLQPIWESLRKYEYTQLRLFVEGSPALQTGRLAVLVNVPAYALKLPVAQSARPDDGLLDIRLFQRGSSFQMVRYFYKVARGLHESLDDVQSARASRVRIEADRPVPIQADGDPAGWTPADVQVLPGALDVIVPHEKATSQFNKAIPCR